MGAIEGARPSAGPARASARLRLPSVPGGHSGSLCPWPAARSDPSVACAVEERGGVAREGARAVVPGPRGLLPPGPKRLLQAFSQTEVLGIRAPGKDSPQLGSRPSTAPTQAASPWKLQRRPGEVGAETQLGGGEGGSNLRLFQAFLGLSSLVASSSHRLLGSGSRRFCRPPHHYRPPPPDCRPSRPRCAAGRGDFGTSPPGRRRRFHPPSRHPSPLSLTHPPGLGPLGRTSRRAGATAEGRGAGGSPAGKRDLPWGREAGYSAAIAKGLG